MKLALFDEHRLGVVIDDRIVDVTTAVTSHENDAETAGWWRGLCRDWAALAPRIADAAKSRDSLPLDGVTLQAPVLNPSKVIAAASNYRAHVDEMHQVQERTLGTVHPWMMEFDVFLKAPSSITGPSGPIVLPPAVLADGHEIHHESELVVIIGRGGKDIPVDEALERVFGYSVGLDITVRSPADRSRRKSYDTFSPIGPWIRVADEEFDPGALDILLTVDGAVRQQVNTADLLMSVPEIVSYASRIMTLNPGDVIFTGAPPGVGPIEAGETLVTTISGIGTMETMVR
ncbi:fumarylacetoacetate hydrolase family protein [Herbiconiux daphne]|uniref:Fumarylacetoacetate hydrolase family protein n=1 Tax=Herbiconiux daphne TaxID=2970914 RepID=A0ABT2H4C8_9MICO|nr:fumarylacetoacetate hydrolase family protein [Herbiconiux daphne]MCS5734780.1 fumarylacetoacetate hydrolase family protein [Herbiconiux daphne]